MNTSINSGFNFNLLNAYQTNQFSDDNPEKNINSEELAKTKNQELGTIPFTEKLPLGQNPLQTSKINILPNLTTLKIATEPDTTNPNINFSENSTTSMFNEYTFIPQNKSLFNSFYTPPFSINSTGNALPTDSNSPIIFNTPIQTTGLGLATQLKFFGKNNSSNYNTNQVQGTTNLSLELGLSSQLNFLAKSPFGFYSSFNHPFGFLNQNNNIFESQSSLLNIPLLTFDFYLKDSLSKPGLLVNETPKISASTEIIKNNIESETTALFVETNKIVNNIIQDIVLSEKVTAQQVQETISVAIDSFPEIEAKLEKLQASIKNEEKKEAIKKALIELIEKKPEIKKEIEKISAEVDATIQNIEKLLSNGDIKEETSLILKELAQWRVIAKEIYPEAAN